MTLGTAHWIIIGLCIAVLAASLAWAAARAVRAIRQTRVYLAEHPRRAGGQHRTGNTDPFASPVAAGETEQFATPADRAAHYRRPAPLEELMRAAEPYQQFRGQP